MNRTILSLGKWLDIAAVEDELYICVFGRTVICDWGRVVVSANDGDIRVVHRVWGLRGSRWLRIARPLERYRLEQEWWRDQQKFFKKKQKRIAQGKELHPVMMTDRQRHEATAAVVRKMKWSKTFAQAMKTPLALQSIENGGYVRGLIPSDSDGIGLEWNATPEQKKKMLGMTREDFIKAQTKGSALPLSGGESK